MRSILVVAGWVFIAVASCTFNPGPAGSVSNGSSGAGYAGNGILGVGTGNAGHAATGAAASSGAAASNGMTPSIDGPNCGLQQYGLQNVPPDLLIILDKSASMSNGPDDKPCNGAAGCQPKWDSMTAAILQVTKQTETTIRWGLKFFANNNTCGVNPGVAVDVGPNNGAAIAAAIGMTNPGGHTPTRLAETSGATYLMSRADPNPKYILLATDGIPNCIPGAQSQTTVDSMGAEQAVLDAATAGIPTFVVGVGNVADAVATLTQMAINGGRPQAAAPRYYPVSSTADLVSVLTTIGGQITSCTFALAMPPPDPTNIGVYGDGVRIPQDKNHANGWDYGAGMTSIELFGAACDNVKSGKTKAVQAVFGCPGQIIP